MPDNSVKFSGILHKFQRELPFCANMSSASFTSGPLLLVCATAHEAAGRSHSGEWHALSDHLFEGRGSQEGCVLLITGIGMTLTALRLGQALAQVRPRMALNFGIAGAFDSGGISLEEVVQVREDSFAELGAMSPSGFMDLQQMGLEHFRLGGMPFYNTITNPTPALPGLRTVTGITVNTVSGDANGILRRQQIWKPEVESMEGAAFFQACLLADVPFHAVRSISNRVEPRNRNAWRIPQALDALHRSLDSLIPALLA